MAFPLQAGVLGGAVGRRRCEVLSGGVLVAGQAPSAVHPLRTSAVALPRASTCSVRVSQAALEAIVMAHHVCLLPVVCIWHSAGTCVLEWQCLLIAAPIRVCTA